MGEVGVGPALEGKGKPQSQADSFWSNPAPAYA